jgi:hypothetical protein
VCVCVCSCNTNGSFITHKRASRPSLTLNAKICPPDGDKKKLVWLKNSARRHRRSRHACTHTRCVVCAIGQCVAGQVRAHARATCGSARTMCVSVCKVYQCMFCGNNYLLLPYSYPNNWATTTTRKCVWAASVHQSVCGDAQIFHLSRECRFI